MADNIYAPKVYWNLSTSRLLTMEFMDAAEITDVSAIQRLGIQPIDVSKLVSLSYNLYFDLFYWWKILYLMLFPSINCVGQPSFCRDDF